MQYVLSLWESPDHTYVKLFDVLYDLFVFSKCIK